MDNKHSVIRNKSMDNIIYIESKESIWIRLHNPYRINNKDIFAIILTGFYNRLNKEYQAVLPYGSVTWIKESWLDLYKI